jgi:synaptic vesicle membrane protein VAT-1
LYPEAPRPPFVPGFEFSGIVAELGPEAKGISVGDRVLGACKFGGYASEIVVPAVQVRKCPQHLSHAEAAAVPVNFLSAWVGLIEMARIRAGDRILVVGASGGAGTAMVQVASGQGARVVGLVGSEDKKQLAREIGAAEVWTYREWREGPAGSAEGFDVVMDPRGAAGLRDSMRRLAPAGRAVSFGVSSLVQGLRRSLPRVLFQLLQTPVFTPIGLSMTNRGIHGLNLLKLFDGASGMSLLRNAMDRVLEGFEQRRFRVIVGKIFPLREAAAAHLYLQSRRSTGKLVLEVP